MLSGIAENSANEILQTLIMSADDISETICFIANLPAAISHKRASDRYYLELDIDERLLPLARLNYYLSRETGMLLTYQGKNIYGCRHSFTFEEFLVMDGEFDKFIENLHSLEPIYQQCCLKTFHDYLHMLSKRFQQFCHCQQQLVDLLCENFDSRFAQIQSIYQHYIDTAELVSKTRIELENLSGSKKNFRCQALTKLLHSSLENLSVIRGLVFANKGSLWHFDVILESLERVEYSLDSLSGEIEFLAKDLQ